MKKILFISAFLMLIMSCENENNLNIKFDNDTKRIYVTKEYIITQKYSGSTGFGRCYWRLESIRNINDIKNVNKNDTI